MLALERWGEGRSRLMAMIAQIAASSAEACLEVAKMARESTLLACDVQGNVTPQSWHRLYRRPDAVRAAVWNAVVAPEQGPQASSDGEFRQNRRAVGVAFREGIKRALTGDVTPRERRIGERLVERYYRRCHLPDLARSLSGDDEPIPAVAADWLGNAEFLFFMGIVVPCLLEYQVTPCELYRFATQCHFDSLEKLLRLDPQMAADKRIDAIMFRMQRTNAEGLKLLRKAQLTRNSKPLSRRAMKYLIGGWLMGFSAELDAALNGELLFEVIEQKVSPHRRAEALRWIKHARAKVARQRVDCRLTAPDIRDLFHAVHADAGRGRFDPDFQKAGKAIYRALERNAALWPGLRKGNKTRAA